MEKYYKLGQEQYLVTLYFEGMYRKTYSKTEQGVHNRWLLHEQDAVPKNICKRLLLCDKFLAKTARPAAEDRGTTPGVTCIQQGMVGDKGEDANEEQGTVANAEGHGNLRVTDG